MLFPTGVDPPLTMAIKAAETNVEDTSVALWTLGEVLMCLTKMMSPLTPFFTGLLLDSLNFVYCVLQPGCGAKLVIFVTTVIAEWVYLRLRKYIVHDTKSARVWNQAQV